MTLFNLKNNETAIIVDCSIKRLCDLGLIPGAEIRMVKTGSPCIVVVHGTNLGIGRGYQVRIKVERKDDGNSQGGMCSV